MHILTNLYGAPRINGEILFPRAKKNLKSPSDILIGTVRSESGDTHPIWFT